MKKLALLLVLVLTGVGCTNKNVPLEKRADLSTKISINTTTSKIDDTSTTPFVRMETSETDFLDSAKSVAVTSTLLEHSKLYQSTEKGFEFRYPEDWDYPQFTSEMQLDYGYVTSSLISSTPFWHLVVGVKKHKSSWCINCGPELDYSYDMYAQPLLDRDVLAGDLLKDGYGSFNLKNIESNGRPALFYAYGGECIGNEAVIFGKQSIIHLFGCDERNPETGKESEDIGQQTMNLIISTFRFLE